MSLATSIRRGTPLIAVAAAVLLAACTDERAQPPVAGPRATLADSADQVMFDVRYNLTDGGVKRGELHADTAYSFEENTRYEFRRVRVDFNTTQGVKNGVLTADRGLYNSRINMLEGYGHVVVVTQDGKKLSSPELKYNQATNEITTDSAFVFEDGDRIDRGIGLKTDPNLNRVQVFKGASTTLKKVQVPTGKP